MRPSKRLALILAACALAAAGCTTSANGQPTPAPDGSSNSTSPPGESSDSASPTADIPPRPRDLSLEGLDPCTLYTDAQRSQLKTDDVKSGETKSEEYKGMLECGLSAESAEPFIDYSALAVTTEGVEVWFTGKRNVDVEQTTVQGFPAAKFKFRGVEDEGCDIAVGVADGQYLWVSVFPLSDGLKQDQLCQMADTAADMAMTTLQTLK